MTHQEANPRGAAALFDERLAFLESQGLRCPVLDIRVGRQGERCRSRCQRDAVCGTHRNLIFRLAADEHYDIPTICEYLGIDRKRVERALREKGLRLQAG